MDGPLAGLRVVDLTQVLSGPYCTMLLADLGADGVKVAPPTGDVARLWGPVVPAPAADPAAPGDVPPGPAVTLLRRLLRQRQLQQAEHLPRPEGRDRQKAAAQPARGGRRPRRELPGGGHGEPRPVLRGAARGFGDRRTGASPYADWPAFDIVAQAMGGIMGVTGQDADHPVKVGPGVGDIFPAVLADVGVLAAVRAAGTTGKGQLVDVAMYDSVLALTERIVYQHSLRGTSPVPQGNTHPLLCPYGVVPTADGFVTVAAPSDHHWRLLADLMGRPELGVDPRFISNEDRLAHARDVYVAIEAWSRTLTTDEVVARLGGRIPCGPVNTAADIARNPHVAARGMIVEVDHPSGGTVEIAGSPIKLTSTPPGRFTPAPTLGEHTDEISAHGFAPAGAAPDEEKQVG